MAKLVVALSLLLATSNAFASKYGVNCNSVGGNPGVRFTPSDIRTVEDLQSDRLYYRVMFNDGRIYQVPKANCIIEVMDDRQSPRL